MLALLLRMPRRRRRCHRNVVLSRLERDPDRRRLVRVQLAFEAVKGRVGQVLDRLVEQEGEERDRAEAVPIDGERECQPLDTRREASLVRSPFSAATTRSTAEGAGR